MQTAIWAGKIKGREIYLLLGSGEIEIVSSKEKTIKAFLQALNNRRKFN